jgi:hypothetical protein
VRVVFTDIALAICCRRQEIAGRWGDAAPAVELALCTLKASRDVRRFLTLPNVTQEDDVMIFTTPSAAVQLRLDEKDGDDGGVCVEVLSIVVEQSRR